MAAFSRMPLQQSTLASAARKRPFLFFGLPFMIILVSGSFALSGITQTRYDLRNSKVQSISKEEELRMNKNRKRVDIREEYFRLKAKSGELDEWENKRVPRLPGEEAMPAPKSKVVGE